MRRTVLPLLTVLALLLVAAGGAAAAGDAGTNITPAEPSDDGDDVGICLVGAESPCNDGKTNDSADGDRIGDNGSDEDGQMRIPEDQNGDGKIDERFRGDDETSEAGICLVGADSPCNDASENGTEATHPMPVNDSTEIGSDAGQGEERMWIPEDQDRDGDIDDPFLGSLGSFADVALPFVGVF